MSTTIFDDPKLYHSVLEDLPIGVYIVDRERRVRFWNRGAEHLTGHLPHEVMGQEASGHLLEPYDRKGRSLSGEHDPITSTLTNGHANSLRPTSDTRMAIVWQYAYEAERFSMMTM